MEMLETQRSKTEAINGNIQGVTRVSFLVQSEREREKGMKKREREGVRGRGKTVYISKIKEEKVTFLFSLS